MLDGSPKGEDKYACGICISKNYSKVLILIQKPSERVQVWAVINEKPVIINRGFNLNRLEKVVCARAAKNRDAC